MAINIGIDFGTCFSEIGFYHGELMALKPSEEKTVMCPSVFYRDKDKKVVGTKAVISGKRNPQCMVEAVKKKLKEPAFGLDGELYEPRQIVQEIFQYLLEGADESLCKEFQKPDEELKVAITVPVKFQEGEIRLIHEAAQSVRLNSGRKVTITGVLKEPAAAALEYFGMQQNKGENIFVYDLGGGTFDIAIMKSTGDAKKPYEVIDQDAKPIGGYNWDQKVEQLLRKKLLSAMIENGVEETVAEKQLTNVHLQKESREFKENLSTAQVWSDEIEIRGEYYGVEITREEFEKSVESLKNQTMRTVKHLMEKHKDLEISQVIMVGGGSHMPHIRAAVEAYFKDVNVKSVKPEMAIAYGAARYAKMLEEVEKPLLQKAAHTYGIGFEDENGNKYIKNLIFKNQSLPAEAEVHCNVQRYNLIPVFETECEAGNDRMDFEPGIMEILQIHIIYGNGLPKGALKQILTLKEDHTLELTVTETDTGRSFSESIKLESKIR